MSWLPAINQSNDTGYLPSLIFSAGGTGNFGINDNIKAIHNDLVKHQWTDDPAGKFAESTLFFFTLPFHSGPAGGFSQAGGSRVLGEFGNNIFIFYDGHSNMGGPFGHGDVDPTDPLATPPIVGISIGLSFAETVSNAVAKLTADTAFNFSIISETSDTANIKVQAKLPGVDSNSPLWSPAGANAAGTPPTGGGYYINSAPSPLGDQMQLLIYEHDAFGGAAIQILLFDGAYAVNAFVLSQVNYRFVCGPYQFSFNAVSGSEPPLADPYSLNRFFLASCLAVPTNGYAADIESAIFVTGDLGHSLFTDVDSSPPNTSLLINGTFKTSWKLPGDPLFPSRHQVIAAWIPILDLGTNGVDGRVANGKPVIHAPMIGVTIQDDLSTTGSKICGQGRIVGMLWDCFVELTRTAYEAQGEGPDLDTYMSWIVDDTFQQLQNAGLWFKIKEVPHP